MKCPNCGAVYDDNCRFCGACGTALEPEKKGTHRVPVLILIGLTVLGLCVYFAATPPAPEATPTEPAYDTPWFSVFSGSLTFDKYVYNGPGDLVVPETVDGRTVVWIGNGCFEDCDALTTVSLPETVELIGQEAFSDCDSLRALDLPPALLNIGPGAFAGCGRLEAIHIPASVVQIGEDAFDDCGSLSFIFYDGTIEQWKDLYPHELSPETAVCCSDGTFSQAE